MITNIHSVGVVWYAFLGWLVKPGRKAGTNSMAGRLQTYPIVAETYEVTLNDINGFPVMPADAEKALDDAAVGKVAEGGERDSLRRIQGRNRNVVTPAGGEPERVHGGCKGSMQLREPEGER